MKTLKRFCGLPALMLLALSIMSSCGDDEYEPPELENYKFEHFEGQVSLQVFSKTFDEKTGSTFVIYEGSGESNLASDFQLYMSHQESPTPQLPQGSKFDVLGGNFQLSNEEGDIVRGTYQGSKALDRQEQWTLTWTIQEALGAFDALPGQLKAEVMRDGLNTYTGLLTGELDSAPEDQSSISYAPTKHRAIRKNGFFHVPGPDTPLFNDFLLKMELDATTLTAIATGVKQCDTATIDL